MTETRTPVPDTENLNRLVPMHIAIIMDGNGRWAKKRLLPRTAGHTAGVKSVRRTVEYCVKKGVKALTLFAFSSENWRRPAEEVSILMQLFVSALESEVQKLHKQGIRLRVIGDTSVFSVKLRRKIEDAERITANNDRFDLLIAANYGGRWDIVQATRKICAEFSAGNIEADDINEDLLQSQLSFSDIPHPDLFIRTGGESRISNFLLWHLAYTELYFTPVLWPDFNESALEDAMHDFSKRQRRFGYTGEQIAQMTSNA
ncbi:MAG: di-trans,poly-cis-decaprenylcistransferase [Gammaproteobacteria bacterium]|nr:di-trans,poly-cis-decaprenylcistransferase [Gammaproteobacteria bacterium]